MKPKIPATYASMNALLIARFPESCAFERAEAIHAFASDYHGGQWSDLYQVLSQSEFRPGPFWRTADAASDMIATLAAEVDYQ